VPSRTNPFVAGLVPGDPQQTNLTYRAGSRAIIQGPRGLPLLKPPYGRVTAIDLKRGEKDDSADHLRWVPSRRSSEIHSGGELEHPVSDFVVEAAEGNRRAL